MKKRKKSMPVAILGFSVLTMLTVIAIKGISAYLIDVDAKQNVFTTGDIQITVTEPNYVDNRAVTPGEVFAKDPTFQNTGTAPAYVRAQIYVPMSSEIKYVDSSENIVTPSQEIELFTYTVNAGWEEVSDNAFKGVYVDSNGTRYNVHTYKYMQNAEEKIIEPNEVIATPVFSNMTTINFLDIDENVNLKVLVNAMAVQTLGGTASEMWTYYVNQNQTGIVRASV